MIVNMLMSVLQIVMMHHCTNADSQTEYAYVAKQHFKQHIKTSDALI